MRARTALVSFSALAWLLAVGYSSARADIATATESLRATFTEANQIITDPATAERPADRLTAVRQLIGRAFDFSGAAEQALGTVQWGARTGTERTAFRSLFASFVQRGFVYWLASVAEVDGSKGGISVSYLGEAPARDHTMVHTAIGRRGGRQVLLDHEMVYLDRRWLVRDVTIDGISLVNNYRAQFNRVLRVSSYPELLERLRERVGQELPRPAAARPDTPAADLVKVPPPLSPPSPPALPPLEPW
jgi:phospholipid transport system substrate-binding protein